MHYREDRILRQRLDKAAFDQQCTTLLKPEHFRICAAVMPIDADFLDQVRTATIEDQEACR